MPQPSAQIFLTKSIKSAILYPSRWQTYRASPLGDVSASHSIGDKSVICDNQQILLNDKDNRSSVFTVRDAETAMMTFTIFAIAVIVGIFLHEFILKQNSIVSSLYTVVVNVSSILSAATLLTLFEEGISLMFLRRAREERAKLREEKAQFKEEKEQFKAEKDELEELRQSNEELRQSNEKLRQEISKLNGKSSTNSSDPEDVEPDK